MSEPHDLPPRESNGHVAAGFGIALVLHLVFQFGAYFALLPFTGTGHLAELNALLPLFGIGLSQLVYVVPAILLLRSRGKTKTAKGVLIAAAVTFLLNAGCFGLMGLG